MPSPNVKLHGRLQTNAQIRRYVDLAKLLDLLRTRQLYFRRADGFADRLEGAMFSGLRELIDQAPRGD